MKKTAWAAPMLMLLLSLTPCAQAVREGVVEDAPMIELREAVSYLPRVRQEKAETGWMLEEAYTEIDTTQMLYADIRACLTSSCRRICAGARSKSCRACESLSSSAYRLGYRFIVQPPPDNGSLRRNGDKYSGMHNLRGQT